MDANAKIRDDNAMDTSHKAGPMRITHFRIKPVTLTLFGRSTEAPDNSRQRATSI